MTSPLGTLDYFAMEASEYLERLRALVDAAEAPAPAELVRYSRALRGAALMANQQPIARAATGLEGLARSVRDGQRSWDGTTKDVAARAVESLTGFVKRSAQSTPADAQAAEQLAKDLEALAGGAAIQFRAPSSSASPAAESSAASLDAGARAFLAREGALIASALGQAAQAIRTAPPARDALQGVLRRMQPLRGLAALGDLPPLPDLLEAVDRAITEIGRLPTTPPGAAEVFEAAAKALTRAASDVTERGLPSADAEESRNFAALVLSTFAAPTGAVSIATLLAEGSPVGTGSPTGPATEGEIDRVMLVSQGEFLAAAADDLGRAKSITQRDLRLHALATALRTLGETAGGRIGDFSSLARDIIGSGIAATAGAEFAAGLRDVGVALQKIPESGPDQALVGSLNLAIQHFLALASGATPAPKAAVPMATAATPAAPTPQKSASSFDSFFNAEHKTGETAAIKLPPKPPAAPAAPAPPAAPVAAPVMAAPSPNGMMALAVPGSTRPNSGIGAAFAAYASIRKSITAPAPSVDAFIAGVVTKPASVAPMAAPPVAAPVATPVAPRPVAAPVMPPRPAIASAPVAAAQAPQAPQAPQATSDAIVDIKDLCYTGSSALTRAAEVRKELIEVLANPMKAAGKMRPLLDELLDLVELAQRS